MRPLSFSQCQDMARCHRLGFVSKSSRRHIWPFLLLCGRLRIPHQQVAKHPDANQVRLDLTRTLFRLTRDQQTQLHRVIETVLQQNGWLRYYQGFNDVCTVFLLTLHPEDVLPACENAALLYFRDFMRHDFAPVHTFLECAYTLIKHDDQALYALITHVALPPYFATSWLLTWFSHNLNDLTAICRLFDFFLSSNPLVPVYFVAALIMSVREDLLAMDPEFTLLHGYLRDVPSRLTLDRVNHLISETNRLWQAYDLHHTFPDTFNHRSKESFTQSLRSVHPPASANGSCLDLTAIIEKDATLLSATQQPRSPA
ncbi:GTPase-activating protein gyp8, partial [Dimargaris xerosporica]